MKDTNLGSVIIYAHKVYDDANCTYDKQNYFIHIDMVAGYADKYSKIFKLFADYYDTLLACYTHDVIEDAKQTYNNLLKHSNKNVADITLAVTDVPAKDRFTRHLLTMPKTIKDHRALILKLFDILANGTYSRNINSSMYGKYKNEYLYRKPIFQNAINLYHADKYNMIYVDQLWNELDQLFN